MDYISLGIHKGFKAEGETTWRKAHCAVQRALPVKDIPCIHAAAQLASPNLGHILGMQSCTRGRGGRAWEGKPSASPCKVSRSNWGSWNNFLVMFFQGFKCSMGGI